jgi:hypothetical protein
MSHLEAESGLGGLSWKNATRNIIVGFSGKSLHGNTW